MGLDVWYVGGRGVELRSRARVTYSLLTPANHERPQAAHLLTYPYPTCCHVANATWQSHDRGKATAGGYKHGHNEMVRKFPKCTGA